MKDFWFLFLMTVLPSLVLSQALIKHSSELGNSAPDTSIKKIRLQYWGRSVITIYQNGRKQKIEKDSLWGYVDSNGTVTRIYHHQSYQVVEKGEIVKYVYKKYVGKGWRTSFAYSKNLDSRIVTRKKKLQKF